MKLLVLGANGQVGWHLVRSLAPLGEVIALDRSQCDLLYPDRLPAIVRRHAPDVLINAAADTAVDKIEADDKGARIVNAEAVGVLARATRAANCLFVHYSTDYVYDGQKPTPYVESDPAHPLNGYGCSKLAGDEAALAANSGAIILRTSWVYSHRGRNFVRTMLDLARTKDSLGVVADQHGAPTYAGAIAGATVQVVRKATAVGGQADANAGIFHLTAGGETTWFDFAQRIFEFALKDGLIARAPKVVPIVTADYPRPAQRPQNSRLSGVRLRDTFGVTLPGWQDGLAVCLKEMNAS